MNRVPIYTIATFFSHGGSLLGTWAFSSCTEGATLCKGGQASHCGGCSYH